MSDERPDAPTSYSTRRWCVAEIAALKKLLQKYGDAALPPDVLELAKNAGADDAYPGWLVLGLAGRLACKWVEDRVGSNSEQNTKEETR